MFYIYAKSHALSVGIAQFCLFSRKEISELGIKFIGLNLSPDKYLKEAPQQNLAAPSLVTFSIALHCY